MRYLSLLLLLLVLSNLQAQTAGCTDPQANNYNAAATINNGSCLYTVKAYNPIEKAVLSNTLSEISGIVFFNGKILALNDGGGGNKLYLLDTTAGTILQTITVEGAENFDWEDIAQDSEYVYVGDVGNNANGNRTDLCVYKILKAAFAFNGDFIIPAGSVQKIRFSYEDQIDFSATGSNNTRFDCEAITIARGQLHLFTKNWTGNYSVHYVLPLEAGTYKATRLDSFNTKGYLVTGADAGGYDEIIFTAYNRLAQCVLFLVYGFDSTNMFFKTGNKRQFQLPGLFSSGQVEAICFVNSIHGFIANEKFTQGTITVSNKLRYFTTSQWIIDYYKNQPLLPEKGLLRYNTTTNKYEVFSGQIWESIH
ncbi:MAG: hypothetical protein V4717_21400 [Bacteroidota bacterium]